MKCNFCSDVFPWKISKYINVIFTSCDFRLDATLVTKVTDRQTDTHTHAHRNRQGHGYSQNCRFV